MGSPVMTLRDIPQNERPRERMQMQGAQALSNAELLAILLRTGTVAESAVRLAERILGEAGSLKGLIDLRLEQLTSIKGVGPAKALQLQAGVELGRRLSRSAPEERHTIRSPGDAAELLMEDMRYLTKEHFVCLFLNTKNHVIGQETVSVGSLNATVVHPREVFRSAIQRSSAAIICAHNHPSGDPTPSHEDIELTKRLAAAGDIVGIELLDHLVIGDQRYISLKEKGYM
ncbi:MAG: repair protein RadC [Paenibacillaceae bacterium]|jgi:DNA repair protein RadC|nr:repair protein RadC [Paenibacillaceae bacterium]